jgi:hypothetical protein
VHLRLAELSKQAHEAAKVGDETPPGGETLGLER